MHFALSLRAVFFKGADTALTWGPAPPCQSHNRHWLLNHSHAKLSTATCLTSSCLEQANDLQEFTQSMPKSRSCMYHTLYFNTVPRDLFSARAACTLCELTPGFPAFRPGTCTLSAVAHITSHDEGAANSTLLTFSWCWPYWYCTSTARSGRMNSVLQLQTDREGTTLFYSKRKKYADSQRLERGGSRTSLWACVLRSGTGRYHNHVWAHGQLSIQRFCRICCNS